jgi:hypothetical protein
MRVGGQRFANALKGIGLALAAAVPLAGLARAADALAPPSPAPDCFRSLYDYLNASASECPLTYAGLALYGTVDVGYGFETNGAPFNRAFGPGAAYLISKATSGPRWLLSPNALSSSVVGLKMSEPIGGGWSLVGDFEFGFDPYSLELSDSPRSLAENNGLPLLTQSSNGDSSRAGQIDNSQGFLGLSNPTFGILTFGRVNTLSLDLVNAYDPMLASNAFSPLGWSGSFAGFGDTEVARATTAFKYRLEVGNFRVSGLAQVGGYDQGNGSNGQIPGGDRGRLRRPVARRRGQLDQGRSVAQQLHRPAQGLRPGRPESDPVEQCRRHARGQIHDWPDEDLRRLRILPAVRPQQHLSERLQEPRRLQRLAGGDHI